MFSIGILLFSIGKLTLAVQDFLQFILHRPDIMQDFLHRPAIVPPDPPGNGMQKGGVYIVS